MGKDAVATDDAYDELESVLSGKGDVPGDEHTGIIEVKDGDDETVIIDDKDDEDGEGKDDKDDDKTIDEDEDKGDEESDDDLESKDDKDDSDESKGSVDEKDDQDQTTQQLLEENTKLRHDLREQSKMSALNQAKMDRVLARLEKVEEKNSDDDDEDEDGEKKVVAPVENDLTELESYQEEIDSIAERRGEVFGEMVELMSLHPKFEDVEEVCSRQNLDDIIEAAAEGMVQKEGGDIVTAQLAVELQIWQKPNPYKYMYEVIKQYHPKYAEDETDEKDDKDDSEVKGKAPDGKAKERGKKLSKTATSALDLGGGDSKGLGEWTADRIDKMDESELHRVPADIYEQYLSGKLDK